MLSLVGMFANSCCTPRLFIPPSQSPSQAAPASTKTYFMLQIAHRFLSNYHKLCAKCVILCILCIFVQCGLISKNPLYRDQNKALENMSMFHVWTPISPENVSQSEGREVGLQSQAVLEPKVWRRLEGRSTQTLAWGTLPHCRTLQGTGPVTSS